MSSFDIIVATNTTFSNFISIDYSHTNQIDAMKLAAKFERLKIYF